MDINNLTIAGRLTKDPELRYTQAGAAAASFTIAVNRSFTNQAGEREADFINCVAWRRTAENIANHFKKGDEIGGIGRVQTRTYDNQEGKRVYVTEVVLESFTFGQKSGGNSGRNTNTAGQGQNANTGQQGRNDDNPFYNDGPPIITDDDLPF